jgi:flagellar operon protein
MDKISNQYASIEQVTDQYLNRTSAERTSAGQLSFEEILRRKQEVTESSELKFSKHASMRLSDRNISLSSEQSARLESGVLRASEKGIQESLVIVDSLAFIVNVPNKTVVTAIDRDNQADQVFTNIDGAVIA